MQITNLRYIEPTNTLIDMTVTDDRGRSYPFTYDPNDPHGDAPKVKKLLTQGGYTIDPYVAPVPQPVPVPSSVTRRQFILTLLSAGLITEQEAIDAATTGKAPAFIAAFFDGLSASDKTAAYITFACMSVVERKHPFVAALARSLKLTDAQVDDLFRAAAVL